jgi:LysM repeat protein
LVTPPSQPGGQGEQGEQGQEVGEPTATNPVLDQLAAFVTQTAAALAGTPIPEEALTATAFTASEIVQATNDAANATPPTPVDATVVPGDRETETPAAPGAAQPTATPVPPGAPQATVIVVPTSTPGIPKTYTIQPGEFLFCIARRFDLNPTELMNLNGLTGSFVRPGTVLQIPQTGNPFPGQRALQPHPTTYIVQQGDNVYSVACAFGDVSPDAIAYANGLTSPFGLTPGQQLIIP